MKAQGWQWIFQTTHVNMVFVVYIVILSEEMAPTSLWGAL